MVPVVSRFETFDSYFLFSFLMLSHKKIVCPFLPLFEKKIFVIYSQNVKVFFYIRSEAQIFRFTLR